jgi:hypothetical protein
MPGEFKVVGTFALTLRNRLVIYGDIASGTVASGEELCIPLNGSLSVTVPIQSVETVGGTPTGSHVALLVGEDEPVGQELIQALNFSGETLVVQTQNEL